jgi:hypothetical protein
MNKNELFVIISEESGQNIICTKNTLMGIFKSNVLKALLKRS